MFKEIICVHFEHYMNQIKSVRERQNILSK
jgi:hypothetical protein